MEMRYQDISVIVLVFATALISSWTHDVPSERHRTFEELTKVIDEAKNKPFLSYNDVETLLAKLHFENCIQTSRSSECWKCFTVSDLYRYFKFDSGSVLNETNFKRVSPAIVYHLLLPEKNPGSSRAVCRSSTLPENLFAAFAANFSGSNAGITLEALDKVLENVNETLGETLTKKRCFSARSVFLEVKEDSASGEDHGHDHDHESGNKQSMDEDEFQNACANILFHLVQGYCIKEDHGELPPKSFFLDNIFENRTYFPEDKLMEVTKKLGIAELSTSGGDSHDVHAHRHRRSLDDRGNSVVFKHGISRRSTDEHGHAENTSYEGKCYSLDDLLDIFDVDHSLGATKSQLKELCPALLQQFTTSSCTEKPTDKTPTPAGLTDKSKVWGYGFAAVTIISLLSLTGVSTIPFAGKKMYKKVLALLVALAVASLAGDALLHLMPHALGLHAHSDEPAAGGHGHGSHEVPDFIWKALVVIASIYCFYLFETVMHLAMSRRTWKHGHYHVDIELPGPSSRHLSFKKRDCSNMEHHTGIPTIPGDEKPHGENGIVLTNVHWEECPSSPSPSIQCAFYDHNCDHNLDESSFTQSSVGESGDENTKPPPKSDDHKHHLKRTRSSLKKSLSRRSVFSEEGGFKADKENGVSSYAWMIIIGDTIHNISDGLAIGAAFSEAGSSGITGGISTSIAVFCHELPHELGDFAVLLSSGMSVKKALLANFLSACSCYIGLVIGLQIGEMSDVRLWIFALAAGIFLYVALVDMLPDLMHNESLHTDALITFILQNAGLLMGFAIILVIAVYEEDLRSIKF